MIQVELFGLVIYLCVGIIIGVFSAWKVKAFIIVWLLLLIYCIVGYFINPVEVSSGLTWWFITDVICVSIGTKIGDDIYNKVFKK